MNLRTALRYLLFESLYRNKHWYWFASTVPFLGQWRVWQRLVLPYLAGKDVLEIGVGIGDLLCDMAAAGYRCQGLDRSPQMLAATEEKLFKRNLQAKLHLGEAQCLPFGDSCFDSVVSTFPTHYIYEGNSIREIARVLRPGGRLIVVEGANLLPVSWTATLMVLVFTLVYGRRSTYNQAQNSTPGARIPLEEAGLTRRIEQPSSALWQAWLVIAEKPVA